MDFVVAQISLLKHVDPVMLMITLAVIWGGAMTWTVKQSPSGLK
ncbi:MAG: hypothetical protein AAFV72_01470 [Cyanobacteria bacterium J06635_1]